jgi:HSP20 family molecular chaperone IbpA
MRLRISLRPSYRSQPTRDKPEPKSERLGNLRAAKSHSISTARDFAKDLKKEPLVNIFDEGEHISVIADIPGLKKKDLTDGIELVDKTLSVFKLGEDIAIPALGKIIDKTLKGGVLNVKIEKEESDLKHPSKSDLDKLKKI